MKKINSRKLQAALFKGAVLLSGVVCTLCAMLFCESIYSFILTTFIGGGIMSVIIEEIK